MYKEHLLNYNDFIEYYFDEIFADNSEDTYSYCPEFEYTDSEYTNSEHD